MSVVKRLILIEGQSTLRSSQE